MYKDAGTTYRQLAPAMVIFSLPWDVRKSCANRQRKIICQTLQGKAVFSIMHVLLNASSMHLHFLLLCKFKYLILERAYCKTAYNRTE